MWKLKIGIALLMLNCFILQSSFAQQSFSQPRLIIGIVVDQMRSDYIYRYWNKLGNDGFKRLIREGFECKNTQYNYIPTYTGPGHASIYTGTTPAIHGIIGNNWYDPLSKSVVYCVADTSYRAIGESGGQVSPGRLLSTTIGDELNLFSNFRSKVIGISLKDRAAVLPAGKSGLAYWLDENSTNFITSNYYISKRQPELPKWLIEFNKRKLPAFYLDTIWKPLYDIKSYTESTDDNNLYEQSLVLSPGAQPVFDYDLRKLDKSDHDLIKKTPFGNSLLKDFAIATIEGEKLGKDEFSDMLFISFSSTDYVGHNYATHAIETEDTYLRLDLEIADFLKYLDQKLGKDNVLLFLTADHGVMQNPVFMNDNKLPGGYVVSSSIADTIRYFFRNKYKNAAIFSYYINDQVWLNDSLLTELKINKKIVIEELSSFLMRLPNVAEVVSKYQLQNAEYLEGRRSLLQNGFNFQRSGDIAIIFNPGYIERSGSGKGTTHSSLYKYDTSVPLLWYGWNIKPGFMSNRVNITDIAATLAIMLNICQPSGCSGKPIDALIR